MGLFSPLKHHLGSNIVLELFPSIEEANLNKVVVLNILIMFSTWGRCSTQKSKWLEIT